MSGKKRRLRGRNPETLFSLEGFARSQQRQSRQSPEPLEIAIEQQEQEANRRRNSPPVRLKSPFKRMRDQESASNGSMSKPKKLTVVDVCSSDEDTETSTTAVKSPTLMTPNPERSSKRTKTTPHVRRSKSGSPGIPPYPRFRPSPGDASNNKNRNTSAKHKSDSLQIDEKSNGKSTSLVRMEEIAENNSKPSRANSYAFTVPPLKSSILSKIKKSTEDIQDMDDDYDNKSDDNNSSAAARSVKKLLESVTNACMNDKGFNFESAGRLPMSCRRRR